MKNTLSILVAIVSLAGVAASIAYAAGIRSQQVEANSNEATAVEGRINKQLTEIKATHRDDMKELGRKLDKIFDYIVKKEGP